MGSDTYRRGAKPAVTLNECPKCGAGSLVTSSLYGVREQVLFVLGAFVYRCHSCDARYAQLGRWTLPLGDPTKDRTHYWIAAAIASGLLVVVAIALWALRRNHRWPF
jgi:hypothetical protein